MKSTHDARGQDAFGLRVADSKVSGVIVRPIAARSVIAAVRDVNLAGRHRARIRGRAAGFVDRRDSDVVGG